MRIYRLGVRSSFPYISFDVRHYFVTEISTHVLLYGLLQFEYVCMYVCAACVRCVSACVRMYVCMDGCRK